MQTSTVRTRTFSEGFTDLDILRSFYILQRSCIRWNQWYCSFYRLLRWLGHSSQLTKCRRLRLHPPKICEFQLGLITKGPLWAVFWTSNSQTQLLRAGAPKKCKTTKTGGSNGLRSLLRFSLEPRHFFKCPASRQLALASNILQVVATAGNRNLNS